MTVRNRILQWRRPLGQPRVRSLPGSRERRQGFSLLEILLALAILGGSLAILSSIAITGADAASEATDLAVARMLCETKMNEQLLNSEVAPVPVSMIPVPADGLPDSGGLARFLYSVEVLPATMQGLLTIRVTVASEELGFNEQPRIQYSLIRWIVDPALGLEQLERDAEAEAELEAEMAAEASADSGSGDAP
ncbi:hypothetical protein FF011L_17380 [Roseimaritima multifibrata]|uniref:Prepilin-type N-terminal cleavage/methylation domain-containing protein n=1 Tax=Roseimaritima multifibrata TaxID=1930274 RepID=A0A517MDM4_9BACT|nr:prepilin-type N-terminal cleavage/methylation domain-containing protein [Roseimaritima multifibrata]QDS92983.1 hypothetical protein FF011L_17380 [Roseimaritima multifibrata]